MPQDKRLIVAKAVLFKLRRVCGSDEAAEAEGVFIAFILPTVCLAQCPQLIREHAFSLPHPVYARRGGRTTCLIVPKQISNDAFRVNKRHGYYDAVVTAEAICRRGDPDAAQRALKVAQTFSRFAVDARVLSRLPACIPAAVDRANARAARGCMVKCITPIAHLGDPDGFTFRLAQGATSEAIHPKRLPSSSSGGGGGGAAGASAGSGSGSGSGSGGVSGVSGALLIRVGHGGMTAGDICENAKSFIFTLKKDFPTVWKYIHEFKLETNVTDSIRFMEINIQR